MSIIQKIRKNSLISQTSLLPEADVILSKDTIPTSIPALNIALGGSLEGGLQSGITTWAGPSKHFKSMFSLIMAKGYLDKYSDGALLFYDSEFGTPIGYFDTLGIDTSRVIHSPITDVEQLKFDLMNQLSNFERTDHVIIIIDSIGNLASKKEVDDALDQKSTADMSRAKQFKSLFRMVTPHLILKDIPMVVVNHTYKTMELYSRDVVSGGTGSYYSSNIIFILGRQQEKEGSDLAGWNFIINVEKSRLVKEKSKIPITVKFNSGLSKWSGLMDIALEAKAVIQPSNRSYSRVNMETGEVEAKKWKLVDTDCAEFWEPILQQKEFKEWIADRYQVSSGSLISDKDIDQEFEKDEQQIDV
jgi:hypothetical protein